MAEREGPGQGDGQWNELNEMTLTVMSNRIRYDKYKKTAGNASDALIEQFSKEKIYYKERILAMTRDLFHERCENDDINRGHDEYLKSCIEYLKWCDITEMVEQDKRTEVREEETASPTLTSPQPPTLEIDESTVSPEQVPAPVPVPVPAPVPVPVPASPTIQNDRILSFANKMCIRKKTMDDFIVMKPIPGNTDEDIKARLPKIRDYHQEITMRVANGGGVGGGSEHNQLD
jgi:hypothetical protein